MIRLLTCCLLVVSVSASCLILTGTAALDSVQTVWYLSIDVRLQGVQRPPVPRLHYCWQRLDKTKRPEEEQNKNQTTKMCVSLSVCPCGGRRFFLRLSLTVTQMFIRFNLNKTSVWWHFFKNLLRLCVSHLISAVLTHRAARGLRFNEGAETRRRPEQVSDQDNGCWAERSTVLHHTLHWCW